MGITRHDPREAILAALNRAREERLDTDPEAKRYGELTDSINALLERLHESKG
jgi:hypothetical protein